LNNTVLLIKVVTISLSSWSSHS